MKKGLIITLVSLAVVGIICLILTTTVIGMYNGAASLRNAYEAKISSNEAEFDNMKKKISQVAQVTDVQMQKLKEIFNSYAQARTGNSDKVIFSWVQESVPNVDQSTYKALINIITGSRDTFTMQQRELVDISREYNQNLAVFPSNVILPMFGFQKITPKIVTSDVTEQSFKTGKDNDNSVFPTK